MSKKVSSKTPQEVLVSLVCTALLIALQVVLSRWLSIQAWNLKIGFSFIPVVIAARLFGPLGSMAVYGIGDIVGTLLFPTGPYFPGFTLSAVICGLVYGLFLYKKSSVLRIVLSVVINQFFCSFLLNSFWISYVYGSPYKALLATRWIQSLGMGVVMILVLVIALERICVPIEKNILSKVRRRKSQPAADAVIQDA
ncbi:MAG: folate family ECF transporter S component [Acutalibacteraceae bacterium]